MKTTLIRNAVVLTGVTFALVCSNPAVADEQSPGSNAAQQYTHNEKSFGGTITALHPKERTMSVKAFLFSKTFNIPENCKVSMEDQPKSSLADLHTGQKVEVAYDDDKGVLIARSIVQSDIVYSGHIKSIDPAKRTLTVEHNAFNRDFAISHDCEVVLNNDRPGSLDDLKVGHTVNVIYERGNGRRVARKIEQKYETFTGTIRAIDASTKTVKAKDLMTVKKFNLASGCKIVVNGNPDCRLSDLRIGDRVAFSYEDDDGILVANRIGKDEKSSNESERAQVAGTKGSMP
jgi:Cu/Ag efflux protein CusF